MYHLTFKDFMTKLKNDLENRIAFDLPDYEFCNFMYKETMEKNKLIFTGKYQNNNYKLVLDYDLNCKVYCHNKDLQNNLTALFF